MKIAKNEGKKVFIDTYAPWCVPCKKMKKVFVDPELADYFNEHFVNVQINMDGKLGSQMHAEYQVVFLPTLLFLDSDGRVLYRRDQLMTASELLSAGKMVNEPELAMKEVIVESIPEEKIVISPPAKTEEVSKQAFPKEKKDEVISPEPLAVNTPVPEGNERILFVLDSTHMNKNPEYLFNVAYLKLQLNELDKYDIAREYLTTQKDWKTLKNMNFIYDFLYSTDDTTFQFFIENIDDFVALKGRSSIDQTLDLMIHMRLYQGYPRPNFEETFELLTYVDRDYGERRTYAYMLDRFLEERQFENYLVKANEYLLKIDPNDDEVIYQKSLIRYTHFPNTTNIKQILKDLKLAIQLNGSNHLYPYLMAKIYYDKGMKFRAKEAIKEAQNILNASGKSSHEVDTLYSKINAL